MGITTSTSQHPYDHTNRTSQTSPHAVVKLYAKSLNTVVLLTLSVRLHIPERERWSLNCNRIESTDLELQVLF
jgi:hypothetical protein